MAPPIHALEGVKLDEPDAVGATLFAAENTLPMVSGITIQLRNFCIQSCIDNITNSARAFFHTQHTQNRHTHNISGITHTHTLHLLPAPWIALWSRLAGRARTESLRAAAAINDVVCATEQEKGRLYMYGTEIYAEGKGRPKRNSGRPEITTRPRGRFGQNKTSENFTIPTWSIAMNQHSRINSAGRRPHRAVSVRTEHTGKVVPLPVAPPIWPSGVPSAVMMLARRASFITEHALTRLP